MIGPFIVLINFTYCECHRLRKKYCILYSVYSKQTSTVPGHKDTVSVIVYLCNYYVARKLN